MDINKLSAIFGTVRTKPPDELGIGTHYYIGMIFTEHKPNTDGKCLQTINFGWVTV